MLFFLRSCVPFSLIVRKMWQSWLIVPAAFVSASRRHHGVVIRPVLKHGPRSLTYVRVFELKTLLRREIDC